LVKLKGFDAKEVSGLLIVGIKKYPPEKSEGYFGVDLFIII